MREAHLQGVGRSNRILAACKSLAGLLQASTKGISPCICPMMAGGLSVSCCACATTERAGADTSATGAGRSDRILAACESLAGLLQASTKGISPCIYLCKAVMTC